ncbi:hypothetical protein I9S53_03390 [Hyphomicrobium sulfonivorans]|nr:hypothetical protein [Hyphomicrobium sulfonivorans]
MRRAALFELDSDCIVPVTSNQIAIHNTSAVPNHPKFGNDWLQKGARQRERMKQKWRCQCGTAIPLSFAG